MKHLAAKIVVLCAAYLISSGHAHSTGLYAGKNGEKRSYIGLNAGINYYFGDLTNNNLHAPLHYRYGVQIAAERELFQATRLCISFFNGNLIGDEMRGRYNLNFKTSLFAPQIGLSYNLLGMGRNGRSSENFALYVSAGVEGIFFSTSGDLKNSKGEKYYYWADGTIRNQPENSYNSASAEEIKRDYAYETDYRNLDMDNVGRYPRHTFGLPLGMAFEASLNMGLAFRVGASWHVTWTDYLDNITANSAGLRKGDSRNDKFLFVYAGVFYKLPVLKARPAYNKSCGYKQTNHGGKRKINRVN
jgi:hypothetical protein